MALNRIMTAMVTPFNDKMEVNYPEAEKLANYLIEHGNDGIVVCGTTGESPTVSAEEKIELFRTVKKAVGSKATVIAGIGSNTTDGSINLARQAEKTGVDGLMAVVPYYNKPSQEGLYQHFRAIAEAISLPLMVYNIPGRTSINLLPETVLRLSEIPNITSIKEAAGSMDQVSEMRRILPEDFLIYSGDDSLTLPMLALGCDGIISVAAHVVGDEIKQLVDAWFNGDPQTALQWHLKLMPMFKGVFVTTNPVPVKYLLKKAGINAGGVKLPLVCAAPEEEAFLDDLYQKIKG
ncbi:dihydrodipicolinate synthase [Desulfitobacterium sp. LBE]|uniref:4-hydroxy-tetrahydrodipicolinate synthase n=2 Tax=Desulfitobacterium hafniense TaxID=49338 RepID=A0A098B142_DESHA|nr:MULTISPECIES: 4-hydroxy-tetrahydrodipicolinate synthase [Desulfitobacterium]EHL08718.1 dihydrodipicolinate synthase [Desulfitobacterium hafniense DP7]TWH60544.1 dihydrodipicolinate synthase [Desulfitobacterium sp. LBE]CDX02594.1 4-hydroxy-tetrahydrodipicolinate synthase [Desulfitobacterium hafniense]